MGAGVEDSAAAGAILPDVYLLPLLLLLLWILLPLLPLF